MGESNRHKELKKKAKEFLISLGLDEIIEEYPMGILYRDHYFNNSAEAYVDVVGFKGIKGYELRYVNRAPGYYEEYPSSWDRIVLVECGETPEYKLRTLSRHFEEVYQLPYGGEIKKVERVHKTKWWEIE